MKKLVFLLLLATFILPACEKKKNDIEIVMPTSPPDLQQMQPVTSPDL
jgi:uncharacterized lipoprotein YajG